MYVDIESVTVGVIFFIVVVVFAFLLRRKYSKEQQELLEARIHEIDRDRRAKRISTHGKIEFTYGGILFNGKLTADMILDRFEELYEYLGIERKELPKNERTHKLVKKQTKGNR